MIDAIMVTAHHLAMPHSQKNLLSSSTMAEMRPEKIGFRLKLLREALGMKPAEMADSLGIERTYWSRFENGRRALTEPNAVLICERYGVSLDYLILGKWNHLPLELAAKMRAVEAKYS